MTRVASCCCGQCTIEVEGEPSLNGVCHCDNCRQRTGAPMAWSVYFRDVQVKARSGPFKIYERTAEISSNPQERFFCDVCGTTMCWTQAAMPGVVGIAAGCFAPDLFPAPTMSQLDGKRCAWITLPADIGVRGQRPAPSGNSGS